ncbi:CGH_1_HP_G0099230.mRNA.1.CDS.1 [Saccharomyces cerevisiae]|nr:CGH_1_HP_G0099230.mRNA.1.CDS.1 [Saccharomyces cerevisiae]CAI6946020.1 CGH_1_HP_G0099230.mRNA.1.CDS.1 [Saccharomyces cerevisiae]
MNGLSARNISRRAFLDIKDKVKRVHSLQKSKPGHSWLLAKVKELVKVEVTEHELTPSQQRELRKSNPGFIVEKRTID